MKRYGLICPEIILLMVAAAFAEIHPVATKVKKSIVIQIHDGNSVIFSSLAGQASLQVMLPGDSVVANYIKWKQEGDVLRLEGGRSKNLTISEAWRALTPELLERIVTVTAAADQRYYMDFGWKTPQEGSYYSFLSREDTTKKYSPSCSGPEFQQAGRQTFTFLGYRTADKLY
jgi:hypothetical protein